MAGPRGPHLIVVPSMSHEVVALDLNDPYAPRPMHLPRLVPLDRSAVFLVPPSQLHKVGDQQRISLKSPPDAAATR